MGCSPVQLYMNMKVLRPGLRIPASAAKAFTLVEVLVVMGIIGVLAALLVPALSRGNAQAQSAACKNRLRQIGLGLQMYVQDNGCYPPLAEKGTTTLCFDRIIPLLSGKLDECVMELSGLYCQQWHRFPRPRHD